MSVDIPSWMMPSCENVNTFSFIVGAASHVLGADRLFQGLGAPPAIHWMLGGVTTEYYCKGSIHTIDAKTTVAMAAGYAGGFLATSMMG